MLAIHAGESSFKILIADHVADRRNDEPLPIRRNIQWSVRVHLDQIEDRPVQHQSQRVPVLSKLLNQLRPPVTTSSIHCITITCLISTTSSPSPNSSSHPASDHDHKAHVRCKTSRPTCFPPDIGPPFQSQQSHPPARTYHVPRPPSHPLNAR